LLTHTSGLGGGYPTGFGELWEKRNRRLSELVDAIPTRTLLHDPGARWAYSNIGIATLGRICEIVSGQSFEQFLTERIFLPLEMRDTYFLVPAAKRSRIATIYEWKDDKLVPAAVDRERANAIYPAPEGGLYSTAPDLLHFYQMMLGGGTYNSKRILSRSAINLMTQNHTGELTAGFAPGLAMGLGWQVVRNTEGMYRGQSIGTYLHGGLWKTYGWIDPDKQLIGILMMQRLSSDGDQSDELNALTQMAAALIE
jgi:CubicO group peptidase (beta-lactamase class C family)